MKLKLIDYKTVLEHYNQSIPTNNIQIKEKAEKLLSKKLCQCIKKVQGKIGNEPSAIGICTRTIFKNRGLKREQFTCRNKYTVNMTKTRKNIKFKKK
jgi:hypothetical protein